CFRRHSLRPSALPTPSGGPSHMRRQGAERTEERRNDEVTENEEANRKKSKWHVGSRRQGASVSLFAIGRRVVSPLFDIANRTTRSPDERSDIRDSGAMPRGRARIPRRRYRPSAL